MNISLKLSRAMIITVVTCLSQLACVQKQTFVFGQPGLHIIVPKAESIFKSMGRSDLKKKKEILLHDAENSTTSWLNKRTGNRYTMTILLHYTKFGKRCRKYQIKLVIKGTAKEYIDSACGTYWGKWHDNNTTWQG